MPVRGFSSGKLLEQQELSREKSPQGHQKSSKLGFKGRQRCDSLRKGT